MTGLANCRCGHAYADHLRPVDKLSGDGSTCTLCPCQVYKSSAPVAPTWYDVNEIKVTYKVSQEGDWEVQITHAGIDGKISTQATVGKCEGYQPPSRDKYPNSLEYNIAQNTFRMMHGPDRSNLNRATNAAFSIIRSYFLGQEK